MSYQLLPRDASSPIPVPVSASLYPAAGSKRIRTFAFFGTAAIAGLFFHLILISVGAAPAREQGLAPTLKDWWQSGSSSPPPSNDSPNDLDYHDADGASCPTALPSMHNASSSYIRPGLGHYVIADEDEWSLENIRRMVEDTNGFYVRDYSLGLGWNNMRYIVEASLLHASLLNRTLVLPSFIYARACEWNITVCAAFAPMVNRGDAIGWGEWRELPIEQQMGWRIPIDVMVDLKILRKYAPAITIREYLLLHNMNPELEQPNGAWAREIYHSGTPTPRLGVIPNHVFDPSEVVRVDVMPPHARQLPQQSSIFDALSRAANGQAAINYEEAKRALHGITKWKNDDEFEEIVDNSGFVVLHTFAGALGMDYLKSVVEPIKQVAMRSSLKGLVDDYKDVAEEVLLLEGETHLNRKPGSLRFTTVEARNRFADMVLHGIVHLPQIEYLADRIARRMRDMNDGRMWMAGHMRRGDFARLGWAMENTVEKHFERIRSRLRDGAERLRQFTKDGVEMHTADVPSVQPGQSFLNAEPPREGDKFYLATDERSPEGLDYIRSHGAVLITDLLLPEDRRIVGWPLLYTDVLAELEQSIMGQAAFFYAHAMSSVAGGVVNIRGAKGFDPRTTLID